MTELSLLTHEGLLALRKALVEKPERVLLCLSELQELSPEIETVPSGLVIAAEVELIQPLAGSKRLIDKFDLENALLIHEALPGLSAMEASDERLWVSLALGEFHRYTMSRWATGLSAKSSSDVLTRFRNNHILMKDSRDKWRNQAISRLWWSRHYAGYFSVPAKETLEFLYYCDSDVISQILGKPLLGTNLRLAEEIISVSRNSWIANDRNWDRDSFRSFMKNLDLLAGRRMLSALSPESLKEEVENIFKESFKIK